MRTNLSQSVFKQFLSGHKDLDKIILHDQKFYTYSDVLKSINELTRLFGNYSETKNHIVGIYLNHGINYISSIFSLYCNQSSLLFLNPKLKKAEVAIIINSSRLNFILLTKDVLPSLEKSEWDIKVIRHDTSLLFGIRKNKFTDSLFWTTSKIIIYTSGSTGNPNGVVLNEYTLSANVHAVNEYLSLSSGDSSIIYTPPGYVYAVNQTLCHLSKLALQYSYGDGLLFPNSLLEKIEHSSITGLATNPTGLRLFTDPKLCTQKPIESIRYVMTGGQPMGNSLLEKTRRKFPQAQVINTYGCTETSARISCWICPPLGEITEEPFPVGFPITGTRIRITDHTGIELPDGETGQILISGPTVMEGYIDGERLSKERIRNNWFNTGDLGKYSLYDGLTLIGRADDIILSGHNKISPVEIELILEGIPGIREAAISYQKDDLLDTKLIAILVLSGEVENSEVKKSCINVCRYKLSNYKQPSKFIFMDEIPKNLYGKIDRKKLHSLIQEF